MTLQVVSFPVQPIVETHLIINCVLVALAVVIVLLRIFTRVSSTAKLWWDDFLILLAMPQGIGMLVIQSLWVPMGIGYPSSSTLANRGIILKLLVAFELIFATSISTIKLSVLFFYLRIFVNRGMRLATKILMGLVLVWTAGNILQVFLICDPFEATYNPAVKGTCGNQIASFIAIGAFNVITDLMILVLPLPTVWTLKMTTAAKIGVTSVFAVGLVVSVVATIRIIFLTGSSIVHLTETMTWPDFLSTFEINLGIICVSMPMLSSLFSRCTARRGASKLEGASDPGCCKRSTGLKQPQTGHSGSVPLESIYSPDSEVHFTSEIAANGRRSPDRLSRAISEVSSMTQESLPDRDRNAIAVEMRWDISRDGASSDQFHNRC